MRHNLPLHADLRRQRFGFGGAPALSSLDPTAVPPAKAGERQTVLQRPPRAGHGAGCQPRAEESSHESEAVERFTEAGAVVVGAGGTGVWLAASADLIWGRHARGFGGGGLSAVPPLRQPSRALQNLPLQDDDRR